MCVCVWVEGVEWERKFSSKLFLRFGFNLKGFEDELEELGFACFEVEE